MDPMEINEILSFLPHRYPFLLIDRVLGFGPGDSIRAIKNVTINEAFFQGHFPGHPVMPGVLVIEALAQASALLAYRKTGVRPDGNSVILFAGIDNARFRQPVYPGDQLTLESVEVKMVRGVGRFKARAMVRDTLVAEAELMAALRRL